MARMPAEEDEATQSANAPESDGSLLVVATTADNSRLYIYRHTQIHMYQHTTIGTSTVGIMTREKTENCKRNHCLYVGAKWGLSNFFRQRYFREIGRDLEGI